MFRIKNLFRFIVRSILVSWGGFFSFGLLVGGVFYYSTLIVVSEIGYHNSLQINDFNSLGEFLVVEKESSTLIFYYNTFWNIMITMTTIGYGDIVARASLSRLIIAMTGSYGAIIFPVLVVTITNLFKISYNEQNSMKILKMMLKKKEIK